jgi:hypothetical protein
MATGAKDAGQQGVYPQFIVNIPKAMAIKFVFIIFEQNIFKNCSQTWWYTPVSQH